MTAEVSQLLLGCLLLIKGWWLLISADVPPIFGVWPNAAHGKEAETLAGTEKGAELPAVPSSFKANLEKGQMGAKKPCSVCGCPKQTRPQVGNSSLLGWQRAAPQPLSQTPKFRRCTWLGKHSQGLVFSIPAPLEPQSKPPPCSSDSSVQSPCEGSRLLYCKVGKEEALSPRPLATRREIQSPAGCATDGATSPGENWTGQGLRSPKSGWIGTISTARSWDGGSRAAQGAGVGSGARSPSPGTGLPSMRPVVLRRAYTRAAGLPEPTRSRRDTDPALSRARGQGREKKRPGVCSGEVGQLIGV